jgi:hypothetical protein
MKRLFIAVLLLIAAVSCAKPTCEELTVDYRASIDAINEEWDDATAIASSTARMSLSGPLGELQGINRDTKQVEVPECAADAHEALLLYQESVIDSFLAFMSQQDDSEVSDLFDKADANLFAWTVTYGHLFEPAGEPPK